MGFRSVFITNDNVISWPSWFVEKYQYEIQFGHSHQGVFYSPNEIKLYREDMADLPRDIQRAIDWDSIYSDRLIIVFLHECGGISRLHIAKDSIRWSEPVEWNETKGITHHYCFGCDRI